jgi:hypothetical protein
VSEVLDSVLAMSHEARRRRRRWRRLRRDRDAVSSTIAAGSEEVMPDFVLSRSGLVAVSTSANDGTP